MRPDDYDEFAGLLDATFDMIGKSPTAKVISPAAKALFFSDLRAYPLPLVRAALAAHRADGERGKWTPTPADLIFQIERHQKRDSRPGCEEAWALALRSQDEQNTVVWTQECAEAFAIAAPVLESSGPISARKTFIEVYERLVMEARQQNKAVHWFVSPGLDKLAHEAAISLAVEVGLLPAPAPVALLEGPEKPITISPHEQLEKLRKLIEDGAAAKRARLEAMAEQRLLAEKTISAEIQAKVDQHLADQVHIRQLERERVARAAP